MRESESAKNQHSVKSQFHTSMWFSCTHTCSGGKDALKAMSSISMETSTESRKSTDECNKF